MIRRIDPVCESADADTALRDVDAFITVAEKSHHEDWNSDREEESLVAAAEAEDEMEEPEDDADMVGVEAGADKSVNGQTDIKTADEEGTYGSVNEARTVRPSPDIVHTWMNLNML